MSKGRIELKDKPTQLTVDIWNLWKKPKKVDFKKDNNQDADKKGENGKDGKKKDDKKDDKSEENSIDNKGIKSALSSWLI